MADKHDVWMTSLSALVTKSQDISHGPWMRQTEYRPVLICRRSAGRVSVTWRKAHRVAAHSTTPFICPIQNVSLACSDIRSDGMRPNWTALP